MYVTFSNLYRVYCKFIIGTSRSTRPTDVLWVITRVGWSEKLETYFRIQFRSLPT